MNRSKLIARIAICTVVCFVIIFLLHCIISQIIKDDTGKRLSVFVISVVISYIIFDIVNVRKLEKEEQKNAQRNINNLSSEFQDVHINSANLISKDEFNCKARLNENGEVVCKIKTDIEVILPIDRFLDYFTID